ncbi:MAG: hotdog fold thioesterase [Clostridiaceae bacterium]|nr:hotdog fold thioesterase [Clostridiaceae bacterium]
MTKELTRLTTEDQVAKLLGFELLEVSPGYAKAEMQIQSSHLNGIGTLHGGIMFSLADYVFAVAANSYGTPTVAVQAGISYYKTPSGPIVSAESKELSNGRKICSYEVEIRDPDGTLVAKFIGTGYRKI